MRKFYTSLLCFAVAISAFSQQQPAKKVTYSQSKKMSVVPYVRDNFYEENESAPAERPQMPISGSSRSSSLWEQVIGYTTYDNQSNNSDQHRIIIDDQEKVHATWTMSFQNNTTWSDRGTGYNSGAGYIWEEEPYERIEDERMGWPGLIRTGDGGEAIICHTGTGAISIQKRSTIGSGSWTIATVPTALGMDFLWPRAVSDGNTIHMIALSAPTGLDGTELNGVNGNIVYWRSDDNGSTWDVQDHVFNEINAAEYSDIESDSYAIDARDGKVSIAIFSEIHDSALLTSNDGGDNWIYTVFMDFPIPGYLSDSLTDIGEDGIIDTIVTTDGTGSLLIDGNGISHVTFGEYAFFDDTEGDSLYTVFLSERLFYWNSTFATDEIYVAGTVQENPNDDDETFDIVVAESPDYRTSLASMSTMAEDADGNLYVVYSAADEEYLGDQVFRHLYVVTSDDSGETWSTPTELTPDIDVNEYEYTFPYMIQDVDDILHIVVQRDYEPGLIVRGDLDDSEENEIVYLAVTTDLDITINTLEIENAFTFNAFPNPTSGNITVTGENLAGMTMRIFDKMGKEMLSTKLTKSFNAGSGQTFDLSFLPAGMYTLSVGNGTNRMSKEILIAK